MKRSTVDGQKFNRLQQRLKLTRWQTIGILEAIWWIAGGGRLGRIGHLSDEWIAILVEWQDDPFDLISALIETGWLEESGSYRLIVTGWSERGQP